MFNDWLDFAAVVLTFGLAGVIIYAMRMFPLLDRPTAKGWTWFVLSLCGIFATRMFFTLKCLEIASAQEIQVVMMSASTVCAFLYIRSKRSRIR